MLSFSQPGVEIRKQQLARYLLWRQPVLKQFKQRRICIYISYSLWIIFQAGRNLPLFVQQEPNPDCIFQYNHNKCKYLG